MIAARESVKPSPASFPATDHTTSPAQLERRNRSRRAGAVPAGGAVAAKARGRRSRGKGGGSACRSDGPARRRMQLASNVPLRIETWLHVLSKQTALSSTAARGSVKPYQASFPERDHTTSLAQPKRGNRSRRPASRPCARRSARGPAGVPNTSGPCSSQCQPT